MKLVPKQVAAEKLDAEIRRRRAVVIDELVAELRLRDFEVEHRPAPKLRKGRRADELLVEPLVVGGERLRILVGQVPRGGNRLRLVVEQDPRRPKEQFPVWAKLDKREPHQGWDALALGESVVALLDELQHQRETVRDAEPHKQRALALRSAAQEALRSIGSPLEVLAYGYPGSDGDTVIDFSVWHLSWLQAEALVNIIVALERAEPCTCEQCAADQKAAVN